MSLLTQNDCQQEQTHEDQSLSGISEQVTPEKSNLSTNDEFQARFEKIFYTVTDNKDNGRMSIVFDTKKLNSSFLLNFSKGISASGASQWNEDMQFSYSEIEMYSQAKESGITAKGQ